MVSHKQIQIVTKIQHKMKNIILIFLLLVTSAAQCQNANILTQTEFNNIKINNKKLGDIINTHGVEGEMRNLFGVPLNKELNSDGYFSRYYYNGFEIGFSSVLSGKAEHILGSFKITNNNSNITIKGINVTIGDNISALGKSVIFRTLSNGIKIIKYKPCVGCNNSITIRFNQVTKIITEIYYIEQT